MDPPPQRSRLLTGTHCRSISLLCVERTFSICKHWCQNGGRQKRNTEEESIPMLAHLGLEFLHLCHRENGPPRWDDDTRKATSYPEWSSMTLQAITTYTYIATGHTLTPAHPFCPWPESDLQVRTHTSPRHTKTQAHTVIEEGAVVLSKNTIKLESQRSRNVLWPCPWLAGCLWETELASRTISSPISGRGVVMPILEGVVWCPWSGL